MEHDDSVIPIRKQSEVREEIERLLKMMRDEEIEKETSEEPIKKGRMKVIIPIEVEIIDHREEDNFPSFVAPYTFLCPIIYHEDCDVEVNQTYYKISDLITEISHQLSRKFDAARWAYEITRRLNVEK